MKKLIFATMLFASFAAFDLKAQVESDKTEVSAQPVGTPVKPEELPDAVKTTLAGEKFSGWEIETAFLVREEEMEYFRINLVNEEAKQTVKIDREGKIL